LCKQSAPANKQNPHPENFYSKYWVKLRDINKTKNKMKRIFLSMMLISGLLIGCGGQESESETETTATPAQEAPQATPDEAEEPEAMDTEIAEVSISVNTVGETMTTMAYEPKQISVPAGALVTLQLKNMATAEAMIHNWVLIETGKQKAVADAGLTAGKDNAYLPDASMYIAATSMANPGEMVEVKFTAPSKKGTYQYICTYPGHTAMKGLFVVQ
jgi:azurin